MSADECRQANWTRIGEQDGRDGRRLALLDERQRDCAEAGFRVDRQAYVSGREYGLMSYCRLDRAAALGLAGGAYEGVCPPAIDGEFRARHEAGRRVHELRGELARFDDRVETVERRLRRSHDDEQEALGQAKTDDERREVRKSFDRKREQWRDELADLDRRLRRARDDLRHAEFNLDRLR